MFLKRFLECVEWDHPLVSYYSRTRSVAWKKQLAFWSTLRSKHGDVAMHLDAQNTVLQTTEVENRVLNVYMCRLWIGRQNPDQMINITKVWWFFPSQQAFKVGELTWPCHMLPVNSTWPWTKVSRWKPPGSWNILTSPGGEFINMDSESHEFRVGYFPMTPGSMFGNFPWIHSDLQQWAQEVPLHIGPCNGDPAVTCGRLKRPRAPGEVRKIIDSKVPNGWGYGLVPWKVRVILLFCCKIRTVMIKVTYHTSLKRTWTFAPENGWMDIDGWNIWVFPKIGVPPFHTPFNDHF